MKHFEELWEEAEQISDEIDIDFIKAIRKIRENIDNLILDTDLTNKSRGASMGDLLFYIAYLSKEYNVNTYAALQDAINEKKAEFFG